jgi:hypothetical protein
MYGYLKDYFLIDHACRMVFFSQGSHGRGNRGRGNWNQGLRRPRFSIHFDIDSEELGQLFHVGFFNWIGQGIVQYRHERPPFQAPQTPSIPVPPHVYLQSKVPKNDGWQEIVHLVVSQHWGWPNLSLHAPPPLNPIVQDAPNHSPVQSSHANKILKMEAHHALDKGKSIVAPSSPSNDSDRSVSSRMHLRDDCSHVISEVKPKGFARPKANLGKSRGDSNNQGRVASQTGKYGF